MADSPHLCPTPTGSPSKAPAARGAVWECECGKFWRMGVSKELGAWSWDRVGAAQGSDHDWRKRKKVREKAKRQRRAEVTDRYWEEQYAKRDRQEQRRLERKREREQGLR